MACEMNTTGVKVIGIILLCLTIIRSVFTTGFLVMSLICIFDGKLLEKCGRPNNTTKTTTNEDDSHTDDIYINVSQKFMDSLYHMGTTVEIVATIIILVIIFKWQRFHGWQYLKALPKMAHFIVWILLLGLWIASAVTVDLGHINNTRNEPELVLSTGLEALLVVLLASAWGFIARQTVKASLTGILSPTSKSYWVSMLMGVYNISLGLFALRMVAFFLYDTSLVAKAINTQDKGNAAGYTTSPDEEVGVKGWESILLVFSCAFRGSLARFYFSKLFQGVLLPEVCDNVPVKVGDRILGARDQRGGRQHTVPWLTAGEEARLLASSHHGYDQTQISSDTDEAQPIYIPPNLCERELGDMVVVTHDNMQQRHLYGSLSEHGDKLPRNIHSDTNKHQPILYIPQKMRTYVDMGVQYNSDIATEHDGDEDSATEHGGDKDVTTGHDGDKDIAIGHDSDKSLAVGHGGNRDIVTGHNDDLQAYYNSKQARARSHIF